MSNYLDLEYLYTEEIISFSEIKDIDKVVLSLDYFDIYDEDIKYKNMFKYEYINTLVLVLKEEYTNKLLNKNILRISNVIETLKSFSNEEFILLSNNHSIYFKFVMNNLVEIEKLDLKKEELENISIGDINIYTENELINKFIFENIKYIKLKKDLNIQNLKYINYILVFIILLLILIKLFIITDFKEEIHEDYSTDINLLNNKKRELEFKQGIYENIKEIKLDFNEIDALVSFLDLIIYLYDIFSVDINKIYYNSNISTVILEINNFDKYIEMKNYLNKYYNINNLNIVNKNKKKGEVIEFTFDILINENKKNQ